MSGKPQDGFELDPQLDADTLLVGDLELSRVLLANDANFPWLILVPMRTGLADLIDAVPDDRAQLMQEVDTVSRALKAITGCDKLNVASLGNMVRQLHVHVIARFEGDAAWPGPIWGKLPAKPYDDDAANKLVEALRARLEITSG